MTQLEQVVGGLDAGGLHDQMTALFNSFDDLAGSPEDPAMRAVVLQRAENVVQGFSRTVAGINDLRQRTITEISDTVRAINNLSEQIAVLDAEISQALAAEANPNTLLDKRDALVKELGRLADVGVVETEDGQVTVSLDGTLLVSNGRANALTVTTSPDAALGLLGYARVAVENAEGRELRISGGELGAGLTAAGQTIPDARRDIDAVAA